MIQSIGDAAKLVIARVAVLRKLREIKSILCADPEAAKAILEELIQQLDGTAESKSCYDGRAHR